MNPYVSPLETTPIHQTIHGLPTGEKKSKCWLFHKWDVWFYHFNSNLAQTERRICKKCGALQIRELIGH